ncbi:ribbon-helix-helix protein, CopG family [Anabaena sp. 4-3]|uniref:ribbon-helix-helix protein, CopG family n=1 Tax=Anabaena sp. 4-3 TaxID=1811979 RepID=UPI0009EF642A|nr:ribbon-helix-helix protein, CopG family [Anabaena sp. 4-3]
MPKQLEPIILSSYASTRLTSEEKSKVAKIATARGQKQSVIIREAVRLYLDQSV